MFWLTVTQTWKFNIKLPTPAEGLFAVIIWWKSELDPNRPFLTLWIIIVKVELCSLITYSECYCFVLLTWWSHFKMSFGGYRHSNSAAYPFLWLNTPPQTNSRYPFHLDDYIIRNKTLKLACTTPACITSLWMSLNLKIFARWKWFIPIVV